jgi:hypothetical protein
MKIIIKTVKNRRDNRFVFNVACDGKSTSNLDYAEMIGLVSALTMPEERPVHLLLTRQQMDEVKKYLRK